MKKKLISLSVMLCMLISLLPVKTFALAAGETFTDGDFTYKVNTDTTTVTLTAIAIDKLVGDITVPQTVTDGTDDYTVTQLGDAFKNQGTKTAEMTSLVLPDSITKFTGTATFYSCKAMKEIHLPASLTGNLTNAFYFCSSLTEVELPAGITACYGSFRESAVRTVKITSTAAVDFYAGSGTADARAWKDGTTGIKILYPSNGTAPKRTSGSFTATVETYEPEITEPDEPGIDEPEIEEPQVNPYTYRVISEEEKTIVITGVNTALSGKVIIPSEIDGYTVVALGDAAFGRNGVLKNVTSVTVPDTVKRIESNNCFYDCKNITEIILPDEMEFIGVGAFTGCSSLTSIVIPTGVTNLTKTFRRCTSLKTVTIPSTVTTIDSAAFATTDSGTDVLPGITIKCAIGSYAEQYAKSRGINYKYSDGPLFSYTENSDGTITITDMADDVEIIGTLEVPQTFEGMTVSAIGDYAFSGRDDIVTISLPQTITAIGTGAFLNCSNISVFEIPYGVTELDKTFLGCNELKTVTIPETVTSISEETFFSDSKENGGKPINRLVIYCKKDSEAENYAIRHSISYEAEEELPKAWDGSADTSWYDADETVYYISTASELAGLRQLVNSGTELFYGKTIHLQNDINMEGSVWKVGIGYYSGTNTENERNFNGIFEGNEHRIINFTYDSTAEADSDANVIIPDVSAHKYHGFFGDLGIYGTVKNLGFENVSITAGTPATKVEGTITGVIAGRSQGTIKHCYVNNILLSGGYYGSFCAQSYAGISGSNSGKIEDCFVKDIDFTAIRAQYNSATKCGITSSNSGTIKDCYVSNPVYDNGTDYYSWNADGSGKDKCPIMFYYDPIVRGNTSNVENVYSTDSYARNGWNAGERTYTDFALMNDKMKSAFEKLTFRTIAPAEYEITVEKADGDKADINPQIGFNYTQAVNIESVNSRTVLLKNNGEAINSVTVKDTDGQSYPYVFTLEFNDDLMWNSDYEITVSGIKDFWNRETASKTVEFKTTGEIVCDSFELYENYGGANERKLTSLNNISGPVTAVIKGLKNNGTNSYDSAVLSIGVLKDSQLVKGAATAVRIGAKETKTDVVKVTTPYLSSTAGADIFIQGVLYKAPDKAIPLIKSVELGD